MGKRILFVIGDLNMGGAQRVLSYVSNSLNKENTTLIYLNNLNVAQSCYEVTSKIIYKRNFISGYNHFLFQIFRIIKKIQKSIWRKSDIFNYLDLYFLNKTIKQAKAEDIILNHEMLFLASSIHHFHPDINIILWMHNNHKTYFENYFKEYKKELVESMRVADKVVCLTDEDRLGYGQYSDNIIKINNPLTIDAKGLRANLDSKVISITCRYAIEHKGLDYLVEIAKKIPEDWKIAVAGSGSMEEEEAFVSLIKSGKVEDKFILRGAIDGTELRQHYQESSIYVMTSRWEGFGLVLTEAMSFGLPILSFENSGANEVLENGKSGILVEQGDVDEFVNQLNWLIESKELREEYSRKSLERVKDFQIENIIEQWEEII